MGAEVFRGGWPDFAVRLGNAIFSVEVKTGGDVPTPHQSSLHDLLRSLGMKVVIVKGDYTNLPLHIKQACRAEGIDL
jgi:hypothetical protein